MKFQEKAKVIKNPQVAHEYFKLTLKAPKVSKLAKPGQFLMIRCSTGTDPLLRRPISLHDINKAKGTIDILYRVIGKGTRYLSGLKSKDELDIIGPLGNGFTVSQTKQTIILIGGGAGIAPMYALAKQFKNKKIYSLIGSDRKDGVLLQKEFKQLGCITLISTDDGSYGKKGFVTDILEELIHKGLDRSKAQIYACGPHLMIKAIQWLTSRHPIDCEVSLEEWMACGVGACNGCTIDTVNGYKKVCSDGPVFNIKEIKE